MIKAIIFDFDGVIHDTFEMAFGAQRQLIKGLTLEEYRSLFDGNIYNNSKITPGITKQFFALVEKEYGAMVIERKIKQELLQMKESFNLFVITSNKEAIINAYFENNNILSIFTSVLGKETHGSKVEKFKMILERHGLGRRECVFVTDTLGDIFEAKEVGIQTIAVDFGFHERERLERGEPFKIISDFEELLPILNSL